MAILRAASALSSAGLLVALLFVWELFSRYVLPLYEPAAALIFPPPSDGIRDAVLLLKQGVLTQHVIASVQRVYLGFLVAAIIGIPLGVIMGLSPTIFRQMTPVIGVLRPIPPVAWIPITLLWFGVTNTQQYFIIFIGTLFPIVLNTIAGVQGIDPVIKRAALSLGADSPAMFKVMLQGALPSIFLGVRTSLGLGWFIIVASEMVSASTGLGFLITEARTAMITQRLYVGMFAIGLIGFLQDQFLLWLRGKLVPWA
jgi:ABC-type nitrate/sulfonate/bicarbonate transport system permease component